MNNLDDRLALNPRRTVSPADEAGRRYVSIGVREGWSDFMAAAVLTKTTDDRSKNFTLGSWLLGHDAGPYSLRTSVNELRYEDTAKMKVAHEASSGASLSTI